MQARTTLPLVFLALLVSAGWSGASVVPTPDGLLIVGDEVWSDGPRTIEGNLTITSGSSLTIIGIDLALSRSNVLVEADATLILRSSTDAPATVRSYEPRGGWNGRVLGTLLIEGTAAHPVTISDIGGIGAFAAGGAATFQKGLTIAGGDVVVDHAEFRNYSSGIYVGGGSGTFRDVQFVSEFGVGLISSGAELSVARAAFSGPGGNMFLSVGAGLADLRDLSFIDTDIALTIRDSRATLQGFHAHNVTTCLSIPGGSAAVVDVTDASCTAFRRNGIDIAGPTRGTTLGTGSVNLTNLTLTADLYVVDGMTVKATNVTIRDSIIGPLNGTGVRAERTLPTYEEMTFQGIQGFNTVLLEPPGPPDALDAAGESGTEGRLQVNRLAYILVVDDQAQPVANARIVILDALSGERIAEARTLSNGYATPFYLPTSYVDAEDLSQTHEYWIEAVVDGTGASSERAEYLPDGTVHTIKLASGPIATGSANVPFFSPLLFVMAIALAILKKAER